MKFAVFWLGLFSCSLCIAAPATGWQEKLNQQLPLLGHRNWILIVDSAYPMQAAPGLETVETNADHLTVLREALKTISGTKHVRPLFFEDRELQFVPEADAPGVEQYRSRLKQLLAGKDIQFLPHEELIGKVDQAGKTFRVLILKTTLAIPYTSVFLQLDCKYWSADAEERLRTAMRRSGK